MHLVPPPPGPTSAPRFPPVPVRSGPASVRLGFAPGVRLVERDSATLQIGLDPGHRTLVHDPPPATAEVLRLIHRGVPVPVATSRVALRHGLPPSTWWTVIEALLAGGFLIEERSPVRALTTSARRTGTVGSTRGTTVGRPDVRLLADAVVVVIGTGRVASSLASLLAAAGTGHVHLDPDRAIRPGDAAPAGLAADLALAAQASTADLPSSTPGADARAPAPDTRGPRQRDRDALAATVRRARPATTVHRPAGYVRPGLVVLSPDGPPDPATSRRLVDDDQPHLAVHAGATRGVVGPLVLPQRSSCLHCHDLYRRDRDSGWPRVRMTLQSGGDAPPVLLATSVAAIAAEQAVQFLTGVARPATVDGTLETTAGQWTFRRRSWRPHPACFCHPQRTGDGRAGGQEQ